MADYEYDIPYSERKKDIEYLQVGYNVIVPVDYVESITVIREELYD